LREEIALVIYERVIAIFKLTSKFYYPSRLQNLYANTFFEKAISVLFIGTRWRKNETWLVFVFCSNVVSNNDQIIYIDR